MSLARWFSLAIVASMVLAGCSPIVLRARFDSYGVVDRAANPAPLVASASEVKVFYGTSPPGFSLRENELTVEPGFAHEIVGTVKIAYQGACKRGGLFKNDVVQHMRVSAMEHGGNAVIYATSVVEDNPTPEQLCKSLVGKEYLGFGWVVVVRESAPVEPAPAPPTPAS